MWQLAQSFSKEVHTYCTPAIVQSVKMTFSWFSLFVLVQCCIQYGKCQIVSSASMEAATNMLSERFARLQQYGLGVNTMMVRMNRWIDI